jgi:hypothetical protein
VVEGAAAAVAGAAEVVGAARGEGGPQPAQPTGALAVSWVPTAVG